MSKGRKGLESDSRKDNLKGNIMERVSLGGGLPQLQVLKTADMAQPQSNSSSTLNTRLVVAENNQFISMPIHMVQIMSKMT
jgi:hypothetical protein